MASGSVVKRGWGCLPVGELSGTSKTGGLGVCAAARCPDLGPGAWL